MRSPHVLGSFALAAALAGLASPICAGEKSWKGKDIVMKRNGVKIGHTDDKGNQVFVAKLTAISYEVLDDVEGWIKVRHGKQAGWFDKAEAVLAAEADAYFGPLIRSNPGNDQNYARRGWAYYVVEDYDKAVADYAQAIRIRPGEIDWYTNRALMFRAKKDYASAIRDLTKAIELNPLGASIYHNRGYTYTFLKEYDKAIADCNESLRLDPENQYAFNRRGLAWKGKKEYDRAIADYSASIRVAPDFMWPYVNRASVWSSIGEYEKAVKDYEKALPLEPHEAFAFNGYAWFLATASNPKFRDGKRAVELATKACEIGKHKVGTHFDTLAAAHAELGEFDEAIRWQKRSLEDAAFMADHGADVKERLLLYLAKKPYVAALVTYKKGVTTDPIDPIKTDTTRIATGPLKGWRDFAAPDGAFKAAFPDLPRAQKQDLPSAAGRTILHSYSHEGVDTTYLVSYFDLSPKFVLTIDTAVNAYVAARKGAVVKSRKVSLHEEYPGRDVLVRIDKDKFSRLIIYIVRQRQFVLAIDGPQTEVESAAADQFIASFKLGR